MTEFDFVLVGLFKAYALVVKIVIVKRMKIIDIEMDFFRSIRNL